VTDDPNPLAPPLPEHPQLRSIALALEGAGLCGEILDATWRLVYESSEQCRAVGMTADEARAFYGMSIIRRTAVDAAHFGVDDESGRRFWRQNAPIMRATLAPSDPSFEEVFAHLSTLAARTEPHPDPPRAWSHTSSIRDDSWHQRWWGGRATFFEMRINDDDGTFVGVLRLARAAMPEGLVVHLARGDQEGYERMASVVEPARRPAAILFADLEASGELSRRVSSRAYFGIVRSLVDLVDGHVVSERGIVGKHAGDGASALFLAEHAGSESAAAASAIRAARAIRDAASKLGPDDVEVRINLGLHWGATILVGQVATRSRLEVTALGDEMNEAARIEGVATEGSALASKDLLERLSPEDAAGLGIDRDNVTYRTVAQLEQSSAKAVRDAGSIPVTAI